MEKSQIKKFLHEHPAINITAFCKEAGITKRYLDYILSGERTLTDETIKKLKPVMEKYGFEHGK